MSENRGSHYPAWDKKGYEGFLSEAKSIKLRQTLILRPCQRCSTTRDTSH